MMASDISELSASKNPALVAAAYFEKTVQIWDVESLEKVAEFPTVFCSGAKNLAFAPSAQILVAGLSTEHGRVAAYSAPNGTPLWERSIVYPSLLRFDTSGESVLCSSADGSSLRLDVHSGATVEKIEGISQYIEGPYGDTLKVPAKTRGKSLLLTSGGCSFEIERLSFGLLDVQFSPDAICLTEACGPVRCVSCSDGTECWRFDPGAGSHVVLLHYSPGMNAFLGVLRHLEKRGARQLLRFDAKSGACRWICDLDSWAEVFLDAIDRVVTSAGEIRDLSNGALVSRLAFAVREYPDA